MPPNQAIDKPPGFPWPVLLTNIVIGIFALTLVWLQMYSESPQTNIEVFPNTGKRVLFANLETRISMLKQVPDPVQREQFGQGLSYYGRRLDQAVPKDARIFLSGMVGKQNTSRGGYYFFLRNYLFPRRLEISLGQPAVYKSDDEAWMDGVDCDSPLVLQTNGFDLFLKFGSDNNIQLIPLSQRGVPKQ